MEEELITKLNIKELRLRTQATAPQGGREPLAGYPVRFFSIFLTWLFARTSVTPNQLNFTSVILFLTGISLFAFNVYTLNFLGIFIIFISIVFDAADGEVARLKKFKPDAGVLYAEPFSHDVQYSLTFIPLTVGAYLATNHVLIVYIGFIATVAKLMLRFAKTRFTSLVLKQKKEEMVMSGEPGEPSIKFNPNVSFSHRVYRFINRNILSSTAFPYPLLVFSLFKRIDLLIWFFAVSFTGLLILNLCKQFPGVSKMSGRMTKLSV